MIKMAVFSAMVLGFAGMGSLIYAQDGAAPPPGSDAPIRSGEELNQLLGPIALYPDPLLAEILPAATFPSQIVEADRYDSEGGDPSQLEQQPWDPSVQALAHYPNVLKWMDDNIAWTTEVGQAFLSQQSDVMNAVQQLRSQAQSLGNLQSTPQESVVADDGDIEIDPTDPNDLYVPTYQPDLIYSQPGVYMSFGVGLPLGLWLAHDWNWHSHHLIYWGPGHPRPGNWWHMNPGERHGEIAAGHAAVWRGGGRPAVVVRGGDRGFATRSTSRVFAPSHPFGPSHAFAPSRPVAAERPLEPSRAPEPVRSVEPERASEPATRTIEPSRAPEVSRPMERSEPSAGVFGGGESSHQVQSFSSRGESSRGVSSGGGGGGARGGSNRH